MRIQPVFFMIDRIFSSHHSTKIDTSFQRHNASRKGVYPSDWRNWMYVPLLSVRFLSDESFLERMRAMIASDYAIYLEFMKLLGTCHILTYCSRSSSRKSRLGGTVSASL